MLVRRREETPLDDKKAQEIVDDWRNAGDKARQLSGVISQHEFRALHHTCDRGLLHAERVFPKLEDGSGRDYSKLVSRLECRVCQVFSKAE